MTRTITVLEPGLFTTVQDLGRPGHARLGVSAAGAADPVALRIANRLAGNPEGAPGLEMTLSGGRYRFEAPAFIALAGADMGAAIDGRPLPPWGAAAVASGATLSCGVARRGARAVLAVRGGFLVPPVLGSASTHVPSGLGGFEGRALRRGDVLALGEPDRDPEPAARRVRQEALARLAPAAFATGASVGSAGALLRVTPGAQADLFAAAARDRLLGEEFTVSASSDRMGLRLEGPTIAKPPGGRMLTEGMPLGAVQVPPGGQPVILFVDHQTTGGYPVIAGVASADLSPVGQLRPGDRVRFEMITFAEARDLLRRQEDLIASEDLFAAEDPSGAEDPSAPEVPRPPGDRPGR